MTDNCLIIATYNGNYKNSMRAPNQHFFVNVKCLLENTNLELFRRIVICIAEETNSEFIHEDYDTYLRSIEETDKIKILWKPNDLFLSYSSYYEGYTKYPMHEYYYFVEDDYILSDTYIHSARKEIEKNGWGYIFGDINYNHPTHVHACHCLCVAKRSALEVIFDSFYEKMESIRVTQNVEHQMAFYKIFKLTSIEGEDFKQSSYSLMFWITKLQNYTYYSNHGKENIVFPVQFYYYFKTNYPNGKLFDAYVFQ